MAVVSSSNGGESFYWNWDALNIRTKTVEMMLEPLVTKVTTLMNQCPSQYKKGVSKKGAVLVDVIEKATSNFIKRGMEIAEEFTDMRADIMTAVEQVEVCGAEMQSTAHEFANDPCSTGKRSAMIRAARALLNAVARLLIIADMADVQLLLKTLFNVSNDLNQIKDASSQQELIDHFKQFDNSIVTLNQQAGRRQRDLKNPFHQQQLAAARAVLRRNAPMLFTSSKAYVRHPELSAAKQNRDFVLEQMTDAVMTIEGVAQAPNDPNASGAYLATIPEMFKLRQGIGELAAAFDLLDELVVIDPPWTYDEDRMRPALEEQLEKIISESALIADSSSTRDPRRERIVSECNVVRQALQDLLRQYLDNLQLHATGRNLSPLLPAAIDNMHHRTHVLRKHLRRAVVDHVSDAFLDVNLPLKLLLDAAGNGDESMLEECAVIFREFGEKLIEVGHLATNLSTNEEGVKFVSLAMREIASLSPQVTNAARVLAARPRSKVAQENMAAFERQWRELLSLFVDAVDELINIDDCLLVCEAHVLEDVNRCVQNLQTGDSAAVDRTAGAIGGRIGRVCHVVQAEMANFEPCLYTERVLETVAALKAQIMPAFQQAVDKAFAQLHAAAAAGQPGVQQWQENEFIDAARHVYDGIRDVRRAVLMIRSQEEMQEMSDIEFQDEEGYEDAEQAGRGYYGDELPLDEAHHYLGLGGDVGYDDSVRAVPLAEEDLIGGLKSDRAIMRDLPSDARARIQEQVEYFQQEKAKLDMEIAKWDDRGNDIIVLAKQMCMVLMEMTDFTRGRGSLKSTMDVIGAAKRISELGSNLDKLAKTIVQTCPDSATKKDLLAYLQRIALYCHQLNITSKVKADVQSVGGELVVSGLESVTSLITAAKNLMNAVVLTVKASYVASTKYPRAAGQKAPGVLWRMKLPEKKPLVPRDNADDVRAHVRKPANVAPEEPLLALSQFQ